MKKLSYAILLFCLVFMSSVGVYSQESNQESVLTYNGDVSLDEYVQLHRLNASWDPITGRGMIWRGSTMITFMLDFPLASINLSTPLEIEPLFYRDLTVRIPEATAQELNRLFAVSTDDEYRRVSTIFIDPGHGGKDPGTIGTLANGEPIYEKNIVLEIARDLAERLQAQYPDKNIVLSRDSDVYLTLEERTNMANSLTNSPDEKIIFISIHANAALNPAVRGTEVWYLPPEYRRQVLDSSDVDSSSADILPILNTIIEEEYTVESIILAQNIDIGLTSMVGDQSESRGLKEMDWYVVRKAYMPSVLIEVGFVTHREEVVLLANPLYLQKLSMGIYNGLTEFIQDFESVSQ